MNKNLTFFNIAKSEKEEKNMMLSDMLKERVTNKRFKGKMLELKNLKKEAESEWNGYFRERWIKDWDENEFPELEQAVMACMDLSKKSFEAMEEEIRILKNLFIAYEKVNEKRKMQWLEEVVAHGRDIGAKGVIIRRKDIFPENVENVREFKKHVKNGETSQIVISGLFSIWVTFPVYKELTPQIIENWGLSKKTCSVEYVL